MQRALRYNSYPYLALLTFGTHQQKIWEQAQHSVSGAGEPNNVAYKGIATST